MRPCILFPRPAIRLLFGLSLVLAACSQEPVLVSAPDRPIGPLLAIGTDPVSGARIETNKDDYLPGEIVHLTGTGWAPNETVSLFMTEDPNTHEDVTRQAVSDSTGAFSMHFYDVQEHDLGVTFTLTATGLTSGSQATAVFTDGIFQIALLTSPTAIVPSISYVVRNGCALSTGASAGTYTGTRIPVNATKVLIFRIPSPSGYTFQSYSAPGLTVTSVAPDSLCIAGSSPSGPDQNKDLTLTYTESNAAPVLGAIGNQSTVEGNALAFTATATDDGLPAPPALTFSLETPGVACLLLYPQVPAGAAITGGGAFSWTPTESQGPGTYCARIQVSDGGLTDFEDIQITVTEGNAAPLLSTIGNQSVNELVQLSFLASATDSDLPANTLTFSLGTPAAACGFPIATGASITGGGAFTWTPTEAQGPGTFCARIVVSDGSDSDFEDIQIAVAEVNVAPVLTGIGNQNVNELIQLSITAAATDADLPANSLTFSLGTPVGCGHPIAAGAAITSGGAFAWTPTEAQGPGTFCARIQVSDGADNDFEDIVITVAEVNLAPVLSVPASFSVAWGVAISGKQASATDADLPANTLTFSLISPPTGMTIDGSTGLISWTPTGAQVGAHPITVRVTDNGTPVLFDETPTFTITVTTHATSLVYNGSTSGQYSDQAKLSATLTDNVTSTAISGQSVSFTFDGTAAGSDATDANGKAEVLYTVPKANGNYNVAASYAGSALYDASGPTSTTFDVDAEDADVTPDADNLSAVQVGVPGGSANFTLKFAVQEDVTPAPEPDVNDGALAGDIGNAGFTLTLVSVASGGNVSPSSCSSAVVGTGYAGIKTFTCSFTNVAVGAYEVAAVVANGGSPSGAYYRGRYDDALTVYDPSLGFVTGGGKFMLDGDRVSFGLVFNFVGKGKTTPRGNLVVVRHHADGSTCRAKSNAIDAPAISLAPIISATFSGKANYGCVDALGVALPGGAGNLTLTGYVEDNGEPGSSSATNADKFWVKVMGELNMTPTGAGNAKPLTGGNIQVPHNK